MCTASLKTVTIYVNRVPVVVSCKAVMQSVVEALVQILVYAGASCHTIKIVAATLVKTVKVVLTNFYKIKDSNIKQTLAHLKIQKNAKLAGATGPDIYQSCGTGYCITNILLEQFQFDDNMFDIFKLATGSSMTLTDLENEVGSAYVMKDPL